MNPQQRLQVQERDRITYELRRKLKEIGAKYQFLHQPPEGSVGLVMTSYPRSYSQVLSSFLESLEFSAINPRKLFRSFSTEEASITVVVHIGADLARSNLPGVVLLITTH